MFCQAKIEVFRCNANIQCLPLFCFPSIVASDFFSYTRSYRNVEVLNIHSPSYELVLFNESLKMIHETVSNSYGSLRFESDSLNRLELLLSLHQYIRNNFSAMSNSKWAENHYL